MYLQMVRIEQQKLTRRRMFWIELGLLVFVVGVGFTVRGMYEVCIDFYSYPFTTSTDVVHNSSLNFPAISICNLNRIHCGNLVLEIVRLREEITNGKAENATATQTSVETLEWMTFKTGCGNQIATIVIDNILDSSERVEGDNYTDTDTIVTYFVPLMTYVKIY